MLSDFLSWLQSFPLVAVVPVSFVVLVLLAWTIYGFAIVALHPHEPYHNPGGLRGFLQEGSLVCSAVASALFVVTLSLGLICACVWLFMRMEFPEVISFAFGIALGLFLLSLIFKAFGIR